MTYGEASNFTYEELSNFTHLEIKLKSLQDVSDKLTRDALLIPPPLSEEINASIAPFNIIPDFSIKTLTDFIHYASIACTTYSDISGKGKLYSVLISAGDKLLQYYNKDKK